MKKPVVYVLVVLSALVFLYVWPGVERYSYRRDCRGAPRMGSPALQALQEAVNELYKRDWKYFRQDKLTREVQMYDTHTGRWIHYVKPTE